MSGALPQTKANRLVCLLKHEDFTATSGWLQLFKDRHEIVYHMLSGAVNFETREK